MCVYTHAYTSQLPLPICDKWLMNNSETQSGCHGKAAMQCNQEPAGRSQTGARQLRIPHPGPQYPHLQNTWLGLKITFSQPRDRDVLIYVLSLRRQLAGSVGPEPCWPHPCGHSSFTYFLCVLYKNYYSPCGPNDIEHFKIPSPDDLVEECAVWCSINIC